MIEIEKLRLYYQNNKVFVTKHAAERFRQRKDVRAAVFSGEIIEQYPDDFPFPSCLIAGHDEKWKILHVCMSDEGSSSRLITAYYPDKAQWNDDFKTRKENKNEMPSM